MTINIHPNSLLVLLLLYLPSISYPLTPIEIGVTASTYDVKHFVAVTDTFGNEHRITLDYFQPNITLQAREFCLGSASVADATGDGGGAAAAGTAPITTDQRKCMDQLIPLLASHQKQLLNEIKDLSINGGSIGVLNLHLEDLNVNTKANPPKKVRHVKKILRHGGLSNVLLQADHLCNANDIDFSQCDRLRSTLIKRYLDAESNGLSFAINLYLNQKENDLQNIGKHFPSTVQSRSDIYELQTRIQTVFNGTKKMMRNIEEYIQKRTEQQVKDKVKSNEIIHELKRKIIMLENQNNVHLSKMNIVPIRRINESMLTYSEYLRHASRGEPLIIVQDAIRSIGHGTNDGRIIPGLPNWSRLRMIEACGNLSFTLSKKATKNETNHWARLEPVGNMTIEKFYSEIDASGNMSNGYMHDQNLQKKCPNLLNDIIIPKWFSQDLMQRTKSNSMNRYWNGYRDYWPSLFVGPGGSTMSYLHADWCDTHAWMGLMSGQKHWRIVPASNRSLLYESSIKMNTFPTDIFTPNYDKYPTMRHVTVYDGILAPNEIIFIPSASAHQVRNLPGETTVAIAMNYVDIANVDQFLNRVNEMSHTNGMSAHRTMSDIIDMFQRMDLGAEREMLNQALSGEEVDMPPMMDFQMFKNQ